VQVTRASSELYQLKSNKEAGESEKSPRRTVTFKRWKEFWEGEWDGWSGLELRVPSWDRAENTLKALAEARGTEDGCSFCRFDAAMGESKARSELSAMRLVAPLAERLWA
jgi:hypothetical protein